MKNTIMRNVQVMDVMQVVLWTYNYEFANFAAHDMFCVL